MAIQKPVKPRFVVPLPRDFPEAKVVFVLVPPYTDDLMTDILRLLADAAERGAECPIAVLKVK